VRCDLSTLEYRERARGDRALNLARSRHVAVHAFADYYDLEVNTTAAIREGAP
jgi:chloramphenicol 3-O-phosphotransferase